MGEWTIYGWTLFGCNWVIRIGLALRILSRRAPTPADYAWLLLVMIAPIPALFVYILIGESRLGRRRAIKTAAAARDVASRTTRLWRLLPGDWPAEERAYKPLSRLVESVCVMPPVRGNALDLLHHAPDLMAALVADINAAHHHVHLMYYIWQPDGGGREVAEAVARAARRGVACRVLVDAVGGKKFWNSDLPGLMRTAGARVEPALPVNFFRRALHRIDLRNHRKLAIIDARTAYCGSQNLTDETYTVRHRIRKKRHLLDATVRVRGPVIHVLQTTFLQEWEVDVEHEIAEIEGLFPDIAEAGESIVHAAPTGPEGQPGAIRQALIEMFFAARTSIVVATPYFVPDDAFKSALASAAFRGVSVTLIIPHLLDNVVAAAAARSHYSEMLRAGVRIMHHKAELLHAKTAVIDDRMAMIGTANLDIRSFFLNLELTLFVYDAAFAGEVARLHEAYLRETVEIDPEAWARRPRSKRLVENAAQLLGPLL